ncbi:DUF488 domain-containing protein [Paeniglutamicibacter sp. ABSL32-1]|uniref:DUF488 domain-containing protein n=1 Tax=Paeniglutamicibacter quisquiliarum TaxID=2849498 RepID=UPI001C2D22EA|nr:DUF488 domain-containing protein [Paeniglutamicibacter quisquiliarum]MBV1779738.1 DUF488 domain-containing protein [Paeniglutamicibacter quisquiliarum]
MGTTRIHTIGHSTHEVAEFIEILRAHGITQVVDIRTIPKSRHNPQFNGEDLAASLESAHIGYRRARELGGLRPTHKDSVNGAWHNDSFRGYADYMQTDEFAAAIEDLLARAATEETVIMCAEAVPWRCHRSLVGDALLVRGAEVRHIMSRSAAMEHTLTSFAQVQGTAITYPPTAQDPGEGTP